MISSWCILSLTILSVLIIQVHTVSYFDNMTITSDMFSNIFFDHVKHVNLSVSKAELKDSEKCILGLQVIANHFTSTDIFPFVDAWGKMPSGLLYGHLQDFGNFDECLDISTNLTVATGITNGKYCFASLPLSEHVTFEHSSLNHNASAHKKAYEDLSVLNIGICVPDVCDADLLTEIFQGALIGVLNGAFKGMKVHNCKMKEEPTFEFINIIGIIIFSTVALLILISTSYDLYTNNYGLLQKELFLAFSVVTNGRKLFKISTNKSVNNISCLIGIRVLSMIWVLYCHCYALSPMQPMINKFDFLLWFKAASTLHVIMATVSVDTFFFISGLLLAWVVLSELDKSNGKIDISMMYLHRYIRLTPAVAAVMLYILAIDKYVGNGPLRELYKEVNGDCIKNWWSTLLYIQNYANPMSICVSQSWYLAVDFQLYFLSPLILIPLWKWGRKFVPVLFLLSFLSIGYIITIFFLYGFNTFMGVLDEDQLKLTYFPTHARYSVWLVGIGLGYFMHKMKNTSIRLPKLIQILGWSVCFFTILAIIYGPYFAINADREKTVLETALFESLRRVTWGIALSWIVFACHFGFGGLINSFLSHEMWQPVSRLTYSMYLVHFTVQSINFGIVKSDIYFSNYTMILGFWSTFGISFTAAVVLALAFESPVLVIEKILFDPNPTSQQAKPKIDTSKTQPEPCQKIP